MKMVLKSRFGVSFIEIANNEMGRAGSSAKKVSIDRNELAYAGY